DGKPIREATLPSSQVVTVAGVPCANGFPTLIDLAALLDDASWEQALESALRKGLTSVEALDRALPELGRARTAGAARIRRVLALRPAGAPPTESLLETLMVQLARDLPGVPPPARRSPSATQTGSSSPASICAGRISASSSSSTVSTTP